MTEPIDPISPEEDPSIDFSHYFQKGEKQKIKQQQELEEIAELQNKNSILGRIKAKSTYILVGLFFVLSGVLIFLLIQNRIPTSSKEIPLEYKDPTQISAPKPNNKK